MKNPPNFLVFSIIVGTIFVILDVFVLSHWSSFAKRRHLNKLWVRIPWLVAAIVLILNFTLVFSRHFFRLNATDTWLFGFVTLWYLPKFPIAFFLLLQDITRVVISGASYIKQLLTKQKKNPAAPVEQDKVSTTSRREFLGKASWSLAAVPYIIAGNGMLRTLYDFTIYQQEIVLPNLPKSLDGLRIVQISDIHAGSFPDSSPFQEAARMVSALKPDVILITGDYVNAKPEELSIIARDLSKLKAPEGVFGTLGNHDHYNTLSEHRRIINTVRELGVDLMINESRRIGGDKSQLVLAGMDNTGFRQHFGRLDESLYGVTEDQAVILMSHDPTFWDIGVVGKAPVGLTLSGHTHGGQIGLQILGLEWSPAQFVYRQWAGLYRTGNQLLYVNRGLGTVGPPMRIGIPPEITHFTLRHA